MHFSTRSSREEEPNALTRALEGARARVEVLDLTVSNPTTAGLPYDAEAILTALSSERALSYDPSPLGLMDARAAVGRAIGLDPRRVAITASTSEAYAVLFKLLCDPGDEVLVPAPSYPLLDWLAAFEGVRLAPYPLVYAGRWQVDLPALAAAITPRTRAIVVVSPNNPTGSYLGAEELEAMLALGLPILSDEVFARYPLAPGGVPEGRVGTVLGARRGLVFALSGLSKHAGLPQMKLGWIGIGGEELLAAAAVHRLETVLDAYLSVGAPVQHALPALLAAGDETARAITARTRANLAVVRSAMAASPSATVLDVEGGWYATLRVPHTMSDEAWAITLVEQDAVHVHPGFFFDMDRGAHLVVSLLTPEPVLVEGIARIARRVRDEA